MKYIQKIWDWLKTNSPMLCLFVFLAVWVWANATVKQAEVNNRNDAVACATLCFPQQSEYLTKGDAGSCWCYTNLNTMNKAE